jgi:hypothetical protein
MYRITSDSDHHREFGFLINAWRTTPYSAAATTPYNTVTFTTCTERGAARTRRFTEGLTLSKKLSQKALSPPPPPGYASEGKAQSHVLAKIFEGKVFWLGWVMVCFYISNRK